MKRILIIIVDEIDPKIRGGIEKPIAIDMPAIETETETGTMMTTKKRKAIAGVVVAVVAKGLQVAGTTKMMTTTETRETRSASDLELQAKAELRTGIETGIGIGTATENATEIESVTEKETGRENENETELRSAGGRMPRLPLPPLW